MSDFFEWLVYFAILALGLRAYQNWSKKRPEKDLLSDAEVISLEKERFPFWYHILYPALILSMIGIAVGVMFLSVALIYSYPRWILSGHEYMALSTNPSGLYLVLLSFFPGLILGGYAITPIFRTFPRISRFAKKLQWKNQGIRLRASSEITGRPFIMFGLVTGTISLILILLAADNYYYVDEQSFYYNSFWSFSEESIHLNELEQVSLGAWPNNGRNAHGINWEYILEFKDGNDFNLKEAGAADLNRLTRFLLARNIPIQITTLDTEAANWIEASGPQELKDLFETAK